MKRFILTSILAMALCIGAKAFDPVKQWGQLQVVGTQLCAQNGEPVVLRGVSFGWHNIWPRFYNKKAVKWLKEDWHPTVIRAAMGVTTVEDNYMDNPTFALECIEPVIKAAIKNNLYVIVDWHSHEMLTDEAVKFFGYIAEKYGKYPHVIYELYNEPVNDSWDDLKVYATKIINEIRKYDPDNVILMGCPHWDQDINLVADSPLQGFTNIMYTVHFYAATHHQYLRDRMVDAIQRGIPVFVSESAGMEASGNGPLDPVEWQAWIDCMEQHKVSWVTWSLSDKDETCSMLLPRATSTGPWKEDVIKKSGKMLRDYLRKYNP
ncbi:MAG: glycoside hydrolase family 5 protein [Prevotella sp.]|nr:glycoside hydrolase family 5 protein [Prevotella sp.]